MKTLISIVIAIIFVAALSCQKEQATKYTQNYDLNTILNDSNWVEVTDTMSINIECMDGDKIAENYVIRDTNDYNKLLDIRWQYFDCPDYELPEIDFDDHTLLGLITRTGFSEITKRVFRKDVNNQYFYNVEINTTSPDKVQESILITNHNWILIPRLKDNYSVIFDTTMKYDY